MGTPRRRASSLLFARWLSTSLAGREYLVRDTMTRLERQLDPGRFVRIHHSAIVHIDRGRELVTDLHSDFSVGTRLALSRTYRPKLEQALGREL